MRTHRLVTLTGVGGVGKTRLAVRVAAQLVAEFPDGVYRSGLYSSACRLFAPYHASKFAVVTISETLHYELALVGAKLKASVLCPGFVKTRIMESERNRPAGLKTPDRVVSEGERAFLSAYREFVGAGIPPSDVAGKVVDAIRDQRFWVFPHPETLDSVRTRMDSVLSETNPVFAPPGGMKERLGM